MRNEILSLLRAEGRIRRLDRGTTVRIVSFFVGHIDANLNATARRHPLGFVVMSEPIGDGINLRYHIWPEDWGVPKGQASGQTHDHQYELNSLIVSGSLRQLTFQSSICMSGGYEVFEVDYKKSDGSSLLRRTGSRAHLDRNADETFEAGTAYRLFPGMVHCVETVERPTATLVLSVASHDAPAPRVFVPLGQEAPGAFARELLNAQEIAVVRDAVAKIMKSTP